MKAELKPEELRTGNTVFLNDGFPVNISAQDIAEFAAGELDFKPIELSEEWLKKAGFTYYRIDGKASLNDDTDQTTGETEYWENKELTIVRWDKGDFTLSNAFSFNLRPVLKYVHQLQNLVHALTGNELIFNHG